MRKKVSVIIPIYKGKKYIKGLCHMLSANADSSKDYGIVIEALFINDDPDNALGINELQIDGVEVRLINNSVNRGIHFSRVMGVNNSSGDFIYFLDQDDIISDFLIYTLVNAIGGHDAVIANAFVRGEVLFLNAYDIEEKYMNETHFPYPGEVMLKKASIPEQWLNNIITANCADDTYLWLLMKKQGKDFCYLGKPVYCHVLTGDNTSEKYDNVIDSVREVYGFLVRDGFVNENDVEKTISKWKRSDSNKDSDNKLNLSKLSEQIWAFDRWMTAREYGLSLNRYLKLYGIKSLWIYGMGFLGKHLYSELKDTETKICGVIEREKRTDLEMETRKVGDKIGSCDAIVVTVIDEYTVIKTQLEQYYDCSIFSLASLLSAAVLI